MKNINNKGFAISTMLYGLLIMAMLIVFLLISIMSTNRHNTTNLVSQIEAELNRYSLSDVDIDYDDGSSPTDPAYNGQEYIVPYEKAGWYRIELWGASGYQHGSNNNNSGLGSYTSGLVYLEENMHLYFYTGEEGRSTCSPYNSANCTKAIYNGGGLGGYFTGTQIYRYGSGGGATDVRITSGKWDDATSLNSRIMVAAGGGSTDNINTGSNGGTLLGEAGNIKEHGSAPGGGGGQMNGGSSNKYRGNFGIGGEGFIPNSTVACCNDSFGAGGGYFGGGGGYSGDTNYCNPQPCTIRGYGGGGSSYISGYAGVNSIKSESDRAVTNDTMHYSNLYFVDGVMIPGVNKGKGRAKIEFVSNNAKDNPPKVNSKLNGVRYITDCTTGNTINDDNHWIEVQAIVNGRNVAKGKNATFPTSFDGIIEDHTKYGMLQGGTKCITVDLGTAYNLDEVAVWHYFADGRSYKSNKTYLNNSEGNSLRTLNRESGTDANLNETETANGIRYSAYQYDKTTAIPSGTYYISSALSENRFLNLTDSLVNGTADEKYADLSLFSGENKQRWIITQIDGGYFTITNADNSKVLQTSDGSSDSGVRTSTGTYQNFDSQKWQITSLGNGYYRIKSKLGNISLAVSGNKTNTTSNITTENNNLLLGQRWTFRKIL